MYSDQIAVCFHAEGQAMGSCLLLHLYLRADEERNAKRVNNFRNQWRGDTKHEVDDIFISIVLNVLPCN